MSFKRNYYTAGRFTRKKRKLDNEQEVGEDGSSLAGIAGYVTTVLAVH